MVFAEQPSAALQEALSLLAEGRAEEAETVVKRAAKVAKGKHGSGSHPLAMAYADMGRLHLRMGKFQKAVAEFQHASKDAMPPDTPSRRDRLGFLYGLAAAFAGAGNFDEAQMVLRQCAMFAKRLYGPSSALAAAAIVPLADVTLRANRPVDALQIAQEAYDTLWRLGDVLITEVVPVRAEAWKAAGKADSPFADLVNLPDELVGRTVAKVIERAPDGNPAHMRAVLADLLALADKKYGDGHAVTCDVLAAVAHHEAAQGAGADASVRAAAVRRSVWSYTVRRLTGGLLANLEVEFEPDGTLHLVPYLAREPEIGEPAQLEGVLTQAVDDLYARPVVRA
ncbi:tetratricopeptide repeat protein [Gemmata sp. G18]|uniref:Tetratricopeptide repeat protein n=1 Tax=Gemmata palustris TaxID=2822762 RepID=A0ABS5C1C0_9BACT|nr:tetratricopeptide repeat protein [Gemmata palustris]MBP3959457.1 tetratricopeptide repeat protein [Gemmata palustris]